MNKNFTPSSTFPRPVTIPQPAPTKLTLEKIRQFARAYTFVSVEIPALGGIVAN